MGGVKLLAVDLDGTLLNDAKQLSLRNQKALEDLLDQGGKVAFASARDSRSIQKTVPIHRPGLFYIACGGTLLFDAAARRQIFSVYLKPESVFQSFAFFQRYGYPVFLNSDADYWVDRCDDRVKMIEERYRLKTKLISNPAGIHQPIMRVSLAAPIQVLEQAQKEAVDALRTDFRAGLASPDWLDLLPLHAGKGQLLAILQQLLGVSPEETMAIGDYESDLSLYSYSKYRVAMGNAVPALKDAASFVTGTNNEDGVSQALAYVR